MATYCVLRSLLLFQFIIYSRSEICGGIINNSEGYISPPMKNETYKSNSFCRWEIVNSQNRSIVLTTTEFAVEDSEGCIWDYLEIRDGYDNQSASIGRFCGYRDIYFVSESSSVYIYFVTDELQNELGFQLHYQTTDKLDHSQCSSIFYREGYITSLGYPDRYPSSTVCVYRIIAPESYYVVLHVLQMTIPDETCLFDRLEIYDGSSSHAANIRTLCGDMEPVTIVSTENEMVLVFISDYMVEDRGYLAEVSFAKQKEDSSKTNMKSSHLNCNHKFQNVMNGIVTSPGYPDLYENNLNCTITIGAPLADHQIMLQFVRLELEESPNCTFDKVSLYLDSYSETPDVSLCGLSTPDQPFYSKEGFLKIQFTTDSLVTWSGFEAKFTVIPRQVCFPRCENDSVCIKDGKHYRCILGKKCATNVCNHGSCVKRGLAEVKCFCHDGYTGLFCTQLVKMEKEKLAFIKGPEDQTIEEGRRVIIHCKVNDETAEYMWFYEDLMLQTDKDFVTVYPGGILHILEFSRKLEGLYKCLATTAADFLELEFRLTLAEPCDLSVEVPPMDTVVEESSVVLMSCYSQQATNVTWFKDDVIIQVNSKFETLNDGQYLAISKVVPSDAGEYTCEVASQGGCQVQRSATLSVIPASGFNEYCARDILVHNPRVRMSGRITQGYTVDNSSAPWHAILRMRSQQKTFCGGNLISRSWLITAAHCIRHFHIEFKEPFAKHKIDIFLGTSNCNGESGIRFGIKSYIVHPGFGERAIYDNDVALIELDRPVVFSDQIQPVCLQPSSIINTNYLNHQLGRKIGRVVGCGQYSEFRKTSPENLREVYVPYVNREECASVNIGHGNFTDSMFCAGYSRRNMGDSCYGDSGGSLTMRLSENHPWVLVGIVSWGVGCDRNDHYGYYTHVSAFENWIQNHTASDSMDL